MIIEGWVSDSYVEIRTWEKIKIITHFRETKHKFGEGRQISHYPSSSVDAFYPITDVNVAVTYVP